MTDTRLARTGSILWLAGFILSAFSGIVKNISLWLQIAGMALLCTAWSGAGEKTKEKKSAGVFSALFATFCLVRLIPVRASSMLASGLTLRAAAWLSMILPAVCFVLEILYVYMSLAALKEDEKNTRIWTLFLASAVVMAAARILSMLYLNVMPQHRTLFLMQKGFLIAAFLFSLIIRILYTKLFFTKDPAKTGSKEVSDEDRNGS